MMKQRWILLGSLAAAAALLFAGGQVLAAGGGHGGGGGGHGGGGHAGGGHVTAVHTGGGHVTAVHAGGGHVNAVHVHGGDFHHSGFGGVGVFVGGYPYYGYGGYGYGGYGYGGGGYYDQSYVAPVYNYPTYVPVPVDVPVPVPSYTPPMTPAQSQAPPTPGTGGDRAPADPVAHLQIKVPADAELWIEGEKTKQTGDTREFSSPALATGRNFVYEIKARWTEGGKEVVKTKRVPVTGGVWLGVDFTRPDESVAPLPKPGTP